ncbi:camp-dependent protein kinase pathway protein [Teratosphaeria destructans]|uniref:Camp-dependent protein kinase pathway protein n=1 Tax=Teratosphaeria destructans TaxID=418781 RepID=A0A9W7SYZ9_9PEZI|nr:camp-dependent protein kinase pathway protein [Teratosphaeria destructans]
MSQPQMNMGGPVQQMNNAGTPSGGAAPIDAVKRLNTAIYDYLLRNQFHDAARSFLKNAEVETEMKKSPNQRNGVGDDGMDIDGNEIKDKPADLPLPLQLGDGVFLQDWWCQFWEIFQGHRGKGKQSTLSYIGAQRQQQKQRTAMMGQNMDQSAMGQVGRYNNMMQMNNGMMGNDLAKRAAMQNQQRNMTPQQQAQLQNMQARSTNQMVSGGQQMERQGSQMDTSGPRSGSPNSGEAPSPKRQRLEGGMQPQMGPGRPGPPGQMPSNQVGPPFPNPENIARVEEMLRANNVDPTRITTQQVHHLAMQPANVQQKAVDSYKNSVKQSMQSALSQVQSGSNGMNNGQMPPNPAMQAAAQGSPMSQPGMEGGNVNEYYTSSANGSRMPMAGPGGAAAAGQAGGSQGNHALQDYQMQLMLLEQQNKKRLLMARQEQDSMAHPPGVGPNGQQFPPNMSPQNGGNPSPGPGDMTRGTPKVGKAGMSPNGDMAGRGSPQPGMMPGGMVPPEIRQQMMQNGQMRPPSSHPGGMPQGMTPEQMQAFQQRGQPQPGMQMANGMWQGQPGPQGPMMPGQPMPGQPGQPNMTPRPSNMAPPPPPGQQGNTGTQPSSPAQPPAPPTPSQANKPKPGAKKADTKKGAANKKGGAAGATPASEADAPPTPTPATPITPMHSQTFNQNQNKQAPNGQPTPQQGQQQGQQAVQQPQGVPQPGAPEMGQPFGSLDGNQFGDMSSLDFADLNGPDVLDNFDFDSFLNTGDGNDGLAGFDANFAFGDGLEAGGDLGGN